jgi:chromate transporter
METDRSAAGNGPSLWAIFLAFTKIGLTSFGGGLSGWMMREFVLKRGWISEEEFLSGLALAQSFPGVNVVNLAIWIGFRLRGGAGAAMGAMGIVVPAMFVAIGLAAVFSQVRNSHTLHIVLAGVAAAAVGLSLQTGIRAARRAARRAVPLVIMTLTFVALFLLKLPLLWVVGAMAPISIGIAWLRLRHEGAGT